MPILKTKFIAIMAALVLVVSFLVAARPALAVDSYTVANTATVTIDEWGVCKDVTNNAGASIMVPTKTANEWNTGGSSFLENLPTGVTAVDCAVGCSNTTINWAPSCSAASGAMTHGENKTVTNTEAGYSGFRSLSCNNGTIDQSGGSCELASVCDGPGISYGGYCWYLGNPSADCYSTCWVHGTGFDVAGSRNYAGSGGSEANCKAVATALGINWASAPLPYQEGPGGGDDDDGIGCYKVLPGGDGIARITPTPATSATGSYPNAQRICACLD